MHTVGGGYFLFDARPCFRAAGCGELAFARAVHAWGVESSALFANLLHYCIASDEDFVGAVKLLLVSEHDIQYCTHT